jgi:hypothetical protein
LFEELDGCNCNQGVGRQLERCGEGDFRDNGGRVRVVVDLVIGERRKLQRLAELFGFFSLVHKTGVPVRPEDQGRGGHDPE